jgi:16S rRNA (uracil1498-N3)-methyltransferase
MTSQLPRFAISPSTLRAGVATITGAELHHLRDVMRLRPGATVALIDESGAEYTGRIDRIEHDCARVEIVNAAPPRPAASIILAAAIIKGPRMDFMVEKAAELGAAELWPLMCSRAVVRDPGIERVTRWRRLALAAAKQSLAPLVMEIRAPLDATGLTQNMPKETLAAVLAPDGDPLAAIVRAARPRAILLACGPEGGFEPAETAALVTAGFRTARLGPNRLRSETAALAGLSVAAAALDELARS